MYCGTVVQPVEDNVLLVVYVMAVPALATATYGLAVFELVRLVP